MLERPQWRALGASVRGASHEARNEPNQDAVGWNDGDGYTRPLVLAVADGHGDPACFRSADGSKLAVQTAHSVLGGLRELPDAADAIDALTRTIVETWIANVDRHRQLAPFDAGERAKLRGDSDDAARFAYGSTFLAMLVFGERMLFAQLGDGDIIVTDDAGRTLRLFAKDASLARHETHSLCETGAWRRLRIVTTKPGDPLPAVAIASTDGYVNSFASDRDFLEIGRDFAALLARDGGSYVATHLDAMLDATSRPGSRDDITAGILTRLPNGAQPRIERAPETERVVHRSVTGRRMPLVLSIAIAFVLGGAYALLFGPASRFLHHR